MLNNLLVSERFGGEYNKIAKSVRGGVPTAVFGVSFENKMRLISALQENSLFIVRDSQTAINSQIMISNITGEEAVYLPPKDDVLLYKTTFNKDSLHRRLTALYKIQIIGVYTYKYIILSLYSHQILY